MGGCEDTVEKQEEGGVCEVLGNPVVVGVEGLIKVTSLQQACHCCCPQQ
jgi:hypothetical protein